MLKWSKFMSVLQRPLRLSFVAMLICSVAIALGLTGIKVTLGQDVGQEDSTFVDPNDHLLWQLPGSLEQYHDIPFAPGELTVGFHANAQSVVNDIVSAMSAQVMEPLRSTSFATASGERAVQSYLLDVPEGQEWAIMEQLLQDPNVAFVVPNWLVFAADGTAETVLAKPESAYPINDPQYESLQWYLQRINANRSWALAYDEAGFDGAFIEVRVAVVDSGIDVNHPEFRNRLLEGRNYVTPNSPPNDDYGHGTHVAGLIGAVANNAIGIAGVAPKVKIDPRKVLDGSGNGTITNVVKGIDDAVNNGADIVNLSLETCGPHPDLRGAVVDAANAGVLVIAAAGNDRCLKPGPDPVSYPARYEQVMAIAATDYSNNRASYSNIGSGCGTVAPGELCEIDIAAPGGERITNQSILSTWPDDVTCTGVNAQSGYCATPGTSMAAAIVSGGAALIKSLRPSLSANAIRQILRDSAYPLDEPVSYVGDGLLDIHAAVRHILPPEITLSTKSFLRELDLATNPYSVTLRMDNPSTTTLDWQAALIVGDAFVQLNHSTHNTATGTLAFGEPVYLSLTVSPTNLITGSHVAVLQIDEIRPDNTRETQLVDLSVIVSPPDNLFHYYFPVIAEGTIQPVAETDYRWEMPVAPADRIVRQIPITGSLGITLPFPFAMKGRTYTDARIYADGFLRFPDVDTSVEQPTQCFPNHAEPSQAIYGWWAELEPSASGGQVSTFQPATDHFVVEFSNVASAQTVTPAYRVSFQMVLYMNGDIRLNYRDALGITDSAPAVVVGVEARDGLFFNQVACKDATMEIGYLPESQQSILFEAPGDIH